MKSTYHISTTFATNYCTVDEFDISGNCVGEALNAEILGRHVGSSFQLSEQVNVGIARWESTQFVSQVQHDGKGSQSAFPPTGY